ncbi:hypothetical protein V8G54_006310 [Vigna mungo]|uniref:Uncharacterized protein n=1 Tax=Vigna mungo TaxID=3915 RepID=A0AAQ3P095_VIGMU
MATSPAADTATKPTVPFGVRSCTTQLAASLRETPLNSINAATSLATVARSIASPLPVAETAQSSLAYVPPPMMGESPIRPTILFTSPPVDVAEASFPLLSTATHPTVPS